MSDSDTELVTAVAKGNGRISKEQWAEVLEWVEFTPYGLVWHKGDGEDEAEWMPPPVYGVMCQGLKRADRGIRWAIGDALNYSGNRSEDYAQFEDTFGYSESSLDQFRRVCNHIPYEERPKYEKVAWTALQITAHLPTKVRDALCGAYVSKQIADTTDLRYEVNYLTALATGKPEPELLPPCPKCGGRVTPRRCKSCGLDFSAAVRWLHDLLKGEDE